MLKLYGNVKGHSIDLSRPVLLTITKRDECPTIFKSRYALIITPDTEVAPGFGAYFSFGDCNVLPKVSNLFELGETFNYLGEGDIVRLDPRGRLTSLFRKNSNYNTILLTEQCNHYCLMCSQPPKTLDDSWLLAQAMELVEVIPRNTPIIGFSGGEPTLYGDKFIDLVQKTKSYLPTTHLDVLTNGRAFNSVSFSEKLASVQHPSLMLGIPLYSDDPVTHDYVVQAEGAYDETLQGILNLKSFDQKVEIRIVIHQQTIGRLVKICEFITRNLLFVDHVALMGLEITGFTRANLGQLWIDPFDYKDELSRAVSVLNSYRIPCSVYNHQLCTVNDDVLESYQRSISSWKNEYVDECMGCTRKSECGGFFSSSKQHKYSSHISPFA